MSKVPNYKPEEMVKHFKYHLDSANIDFSEVCEYDSERLDRFYEAWNKMLYNMEMVLAIVKHD